MIRSLLALAFLLLYTPPASLLAIALARLTGRASFLYRFSALGIRTFLWLSPLRIELSGREKAGDFRNVVLLPNHESHLDAPLLFVVLGVDYKAVAKKELFSLPFFGKVIELAGFIPLDRRDRTRARASMSRAADSLKAGNCLLIFPEGTRTRTGRLGDFKKGAVVAAIEAGSRVVPVALEGFREALPRGSLLPRPGLLQVRVLDPIEAGLYSYDQREKLLERVRASIAKALGEDAVDGRTDAVAPGR